MHRISQELGTIINKGIVTKLGPCDNCSTKEGESELSITGI